MADHEGHITWTVSQPRPDGSDSHERAFAELVTRCRDLVEQRFPDEEGYDVTQTSLSGPVEGERIGVSRGGFRASISVQRFERRQFERRDGHPLEVRLVAYRSDARPQARGPDHTLARWGLAAVALGTVGLGALALGSAGLISPWLQAMLLIPALVAWRTCATIGIARSMRRQALSEGRPQLVAREVEEARRRWRELMPVLAAQRELIGERLGLPPFRNPARPKQASSAA